MSCVICRKDILDSEAMFEMTCGKHLAHASHNSVKCTSAECGGGSSSNDGGGGGGGKAVTGESEETRRRKARMPMRVNEPLNPRAAASAGDASGRGSEGSSLRKWIGSMLASVAGIKASTSGVAPHEMGDDPFVLIRSRVPLKEVLVEKHGYDITELINDHGVTINDFFGNGYTMAEMCDAFSSRMNKQDGLNVLTGLGMHEGHFRSVPEMAQLNIVQKVLGYKPKDMIERFGYVYRSPVTEGGWTLPELLMVGLKLPDVMRAGLRFDVQWNELKSTAATQQQWEQFGETPEIVASLLPAAGYAPPQQQQYYHHPQPVQSQSHYQQPQLQPQQPTRYVVEAVSFPVNLVPAEPSQYQKQQQLLQQQQQAREIENQRQLQAQQAYTEARRLDAVRQQQEALRRDHMMRIEEQKQLHQQRVAQAKQQVTLRPAAQPIAAVAVNSSSSSAPRLIPRKSMVPN